MCVPFTPRVCLTLSVSLRQGDRSLAVDPERDPFAEIFLFHHSQLENVGGAYPPYCCSVVDLAENCTVGRVKTYNLDLTTDNGGRLYYAGVPVPQSNNATVAFVRDLFFA